MLRKCVFLVAFVLTAGACASKFTWAQQVLNVFPERRQVCIPNPPRWQAGSLPFNEIPYTVVSERQREELKMSLDQAIHLALQNADVIRVLGGITALSSGRTVYDVSIANTNIDQQTSVFDPTFDFTSTMSKTDQPFAIFDPGDPTQAILTGSSTDAINTSIGLNKRMFDGGTVGLNVNAIGSYFEPGVVPLEPEYRSFVEIALRQPLLRGAGRAANLAPVVIAQIDTDRSWFQFKDSTQELVRGVIAAYWNLVAARVDVWARLQQIEQLQFAYDRALARKDEGLARAADVAQARSALANFRANLITSRSNLILTETALRNILGLDPSNQNVIVPTSLPELQKIDFDWEELLILAEQNRPDIIELKLILEADRQLLIQADNLAKPQFDGIANYRWNGLTGEMPNGALLPNDPGRFAGFNLGVNFSVPIGLRQDRAALRRQELLLMRDQTNLDQGIHQMIHQLTINYRNIDQFFEQYGAFKEARAAARLNFENQAGEVVEGRREFINVLQAITDWGNAVSAEASSITQYNTELANIERETGTILETHGVRFVEERYGSIAPSWLGLRRNCASYSKKILPGSETDRYPDSENNSDDSFNLENLDIRKSLRESEVPLEDQRDRYELDPPSRPDNAASFRPTIRPAVRPVSPNTRPTIRRLPPTTEVELSEANQASVTDKRRMADLFR